MANLNRPRPDPATRLLLLGQERVRALVRWRILGAGINGAGRIRRIPKQCFAGRLLAFVERPVSAFVKDDKALVAKGARRGINRNGRVGRVSKIFRSEKDCRASVFVSDLVNLERTIFIAVEDRS